MSETGLSEAALPERLILVRHGESVFTADQVLNGDPTIDGPLTDLGRSQARRVAEDLRRTPIDLAISSGFPRTRETAQIIVAGREVPHEVMPDLNDPPVGEFEGKPFDDYFEWIYERDWHDTRAGCESQFESVGRYLGALTQIAAREARSVLVVAHAFVISLTLTVADPASRPILLQYEKEVELATPYTIAGDDLRLGLQRARTELAALERQG